MYLGLSFQRAGLLISIIMLSACSVAMPVAHEARTSDAPAVRAPLTLVAIGDMPYRPQDVAGFEALLDTINAMPRDLTIHVGDIKGGGTPCTDAVFARQRDYFDSVSGPLVFTPGDNEWTDCHRKSAGGYDPRERLAALRDVFFDQPTQSLGQAPIAVEPQSAVDASAPEMIENARWTQNGVQFVTAHVVGSNNGLNPEDPGAIAEYTTRNAASTAWIRDGFAQARANGAYAVVLAIHADMFQLYGIGGGFRDTLAAISSGATAFGGPVLVIHGDSHVYKLDTPFHGPNGRLLENVFRMEVPGAADIRAVRVRIDPDASQIFAFEAFGPS